MIAAALTVVLGLGLVCPPAFADNAGSWSVGDGRISREVTAIVLESPDVEIQLKTSPEKDIVIAETSSSELSEDQQVHWQLDGTTLRIKYQNSFWNIFGFLLGEVKRSLTVTLPEDLVLDSLKISVASADVITDVLKAQEADFNSASGDVTLNLTGDMKKAEFSSASGNIKAILDNAEEVRAEASSGNISLTMKTAKQMKMDTSSGDITVSADEAASLTLKTASGDVNMSLARASEDAAVVTASGDVVLTLPENADITLEYSTASGDFTTSLPMTASNHTYISGTGAGHMKITTASGDISVR